MSETLSTLIAFIGFLIVFSMLVQAVQEGFKNVLKLKTGVWERFFINLYKKDFFSIEDRKEKIPDTKSLFKQTQKNIIKTVTLSMKTPYNSGIDFIKNKPQRKGFSCMTRISKGW